MTVEMRPFTKNGEEFVLVKTTGTRRCDDIKRILDRTTPGGGYRADCDVDVLELKKVNKDGTLETVQKKLVEKPTVDTRKELVKDNYVEKRITKENLKTGEKSVVENVRRHLPYTDNLQNVKVEVPEKVNIDYSKKGSTWYGFKKVDEVRSMFLDLTEKAKPGSLRVDKEILSNTAKRLLKRGLR
ncbi:hypothetical protein J6E39_00265 [bacterium]|nr:hypothetical protein [bacterium]